MDGKVDDLGVPIKNTNNNTATETDDLGVPKKKNLDTTSINSESPLPSESTENGSDLEVPSTSKIKQANVKRIELGNSSIIKDKMSQAFAANPNRVYQKTFIDTLAKKGYDKKQLEQYADSLNTPENYKSPTEGMDLNNTVGNMLGDYGKKVGETFMAGNKQLNEAVDEIPLKIKEINTSKPITDIDFAHPILKGALGAMTAIASPVIAGFNMATEGIEKAAKETLPEPQAKVVGQALPTVFSLAHKAAASLGYTPEQDTNGDILLSFVDFIIGGKAMEVGGKTIKSAKEFKTVAEKASKGELNPEEQKQFENGVNEIKNTSLEDIKKTAEQHDTPQAKEVVEKINEVKPISHDKLHDELAALQQAHDALPEGEAKSILYQKIDFKNQEIEEAAKNQVDNTLAEANDKAQSEATINDLDEKINQANADKEKISDNPVASKVIEDHINNLTKQKEAVTIPSEPTFNESEPFDDKDYSKGKTSESIAKEEGLEFSSPDEVQRFVAEKSENPLELASEYLKIETELAKDKKSYKDQLLDDANIKLTTQEFKDISDKSNLSNSTAKEFLDENRKVPFDTKLDEIKNGTGIEITPDELADYINRKEAGKYIPKDTPIKTKFKNRFADLTGKDLTPSRAKSIIESENKKYVKDYDKYLKSENISQNDAEQQYYEGIRNGTIPYSDTERVSNAQRNQEGANGGSGDLRANLRRQIETLETEGESGTKTEELRRTLDAIEKMFSQNGEKKSPVAESLPNEIPTPKETGISEEMRAKQRKELGLDDLPPIDKNVSEHKHEYLNKEANRLIESGEVDFRRLAEGVVNENRATNDLDKAVLLRGATELGKEIENSKSEIETARANGNKEADEIASDKYLKALSDLDNVHNALTITGTEAGRNLAAMKQSMREDYSIGSLYTRFKRANGDKSLPKEIIDRLDNYSVQIKELDAKIKDQEEQLKKQGLDIENLQTKKATTKERIKEVREKRTKLFDDWKAHRNKTPDVTKQGLPISDEDIIFAGKIALSYLEEGYLTTLQVSKQLKKDVKEHLGIKLSGDDVSEIFNQEADGKKIIDNFDNNGISTNKKSLSDLIKKEEKATEKFGKKEAGDKNTAKPDEQKIKEKALTEGSNRVLNDLKLERAKLKRKINNEQDAVEYANKTTSQKVKEGVANVLNVPRSLMASFDFSAPLRQGLVASAAHTKLAGKAFGEMFKQAFSQDNFDNWLIKYKETPDYKLAHNSELYIADPSDLHLNGREESFMSNLAERIPIIGLGIKASERAYVGYLNKLRSDVFKQGVEQLQKNGKDFEKNPEDFKALADFINSSTGRGKLPNKTIEDAAPLLNSLFFSPRLIASRINLLNPVYYAKMPASVRVRALTDMAKFAGFAVSVLAIAKASGLQVETDPRSSDFGKIKKGDTRYDVLGGFQQYIRLGAQLITGQKKSTTTGKIEDLNPAKFPYTSRGGQLGSFARAKLSPAAGIGMDFLTGRDAVGLPVTWQNELYTHFSPLQLQDGLQAYEKGGMNKVAQVMIPSMFGVGVQTYSSKKTHDQLKKEFDKMARE